MRASDCLLVIGLLLAASARAKEGDDACSLLTGADIEKVQGEGVIATKGSEPERAAFAVSQCFYTLPTFTNSVSLQLIRKDPSDPAAVEPREYWRTRFHPSADVLEKAREEGEKESNPPTPVQGVGDEAFWVGDAVVGALYVLEDNGYLLISIGGREETSVRIKKTKQLAKRAIRRLRSARQEGV